MARRSPSRSASQSPRKERPPPADNRSQGSVAVSQHIETESAGARRCTLPKMTSPPNTYPLLDAIESPADLRQMPVAKLPEVAQELRQFLIHTVSTRGGHFAAGLGAVELAVALHYVYDTPHDRLVWDVGHQAYPHKVLTGRRDRLHSIKQPG